MLNKNIEKILSLYNVVDDVIIVDTEGIIVYAEAFREGAYSYTVSEIIGKHLFDVYPSSNDKTSNIYKVIQTQQPIMNFEATWRSYLGDIHSGIVDTLPIFNAEKMIGVIELAKFTDDNNINQRGIHIGNFAQYASADKHYTVDDIVTSAPIMMQLKNDIKVVSRNDLSVMIYGETGAGKEMVAEAIHTLSSRRNKPFISQNCAAIPNNLLESILFGTEKGGFTGAENKKGLFELAHGGTLFLDEINSMDTNAQCKILKAIEEKEIMHIGGQYSIPVDIRVICALNEDPIAAMKKGKLREDLFYRLSGVMFEIPPLRQRREDIDVLSNHFIEEYSQTSGSPLVTLSSDVSSLFHKYRWPGNVRELKNIIESSICFCDGKTIQLKDLPAYMRDADLTVTYDYKGGLQKAVSDLEKELISKALQENKTKAMAAKQLKITRQVLNYKINQLGIDI